MSNSDGTTVVGMAEINYTPFLRKMGGDREESLCVLCTCPLCKGDLSDDYVLVRRSLLDNFTLCSRCGYAWEKNKKMPKRCPNCGSYKWTNPPTQNHCLRCGHSWYSRRGTKPSKCPHCRSKNWYKTDRDLLDEEIATAMRQLEKIPESGDDVLQDDGESGRIMEVAVQRCFLGQDVFTTAIELSVPILDLILNLKSKGIEVRIR